MSAWHLTGVENESWYEFCYWNTVFEQSVLDYFGSFTTLPFLKILAANQVGTNEKVIILIFHSVTLEIVNIVLTSNISMKELCIASIFASCFHIDVLFLTS